MDPGFTPTQFVFATLLGGTSTLLMVRYSSRRYQILTAIAFFASGLMIQGYCLVDELLMACFIIALALKTMISRNGSIPSHRISWHLIIFVAMCAYMIVQSIRGILFQEQVVLARWTVYYALLAVISAYLASVDLKLVGYRNIMITVLVSALLFGLAWLAHDAYGMIFRGFAYLDETQGMEWSGSAYATYPLSLTLPVAFVLTKDAERKIRSLSWFYVYVFIFLAVIYDSRAAQMTFLVCTLLSWKRINIYRFAATMASATVIVYFVFSMYIYKGSTMSYWERMGEVSEGLLSAAEILYNPKETDSDRNAHFLAAFDSLNSEGPLYSLFGYGINAHKRVIAPYVAERMYQKTALYDIGTEVRTSAFTAIQVDSGYVGTAFFLVCWGMAIIQMRSRMKGLYFMDKCMLTSIGVIAIAWTLISNIQDMFLFYFVVMPNGYLSALAGYTVEQQQRKLIT